MAVSLAENDMDESLTMTLKESLEFNVVKANLPRLIKKLLPEEIGVQLYSCNIIPQGVYHAMFERSVLREDRVRELLTAVMDCIQTDKSKFEQFCTVLEDSKKPSISDLGKHLKTELEAALKAHMKAEEPSSERYTLLKSELEFFNSLLQSTDENAEAKYTLIKERVSRFISQSFASGESSKSIQASLNNICSVELLVPVDLRDSCFRELERQRGEFDVNNEVPVDPSSTVEDENAAPQLFSKDNVYHAFLLSMVLFLNDSINYSSFFEKNHKHAFDEIAMSVDSQEENKMIERYVIARKARTLFVAFKGEPLLSSWQKKYSSLSEGISIQKERIPIRFFVDYLQKKDGDQVIFTGFSFGATLAMAVCSDLWNQTCLEISDLRDNVACFGFGAPIFSLSCVQEIFDDGQVDNTHLFYVHDDVLPRLIQCVDFPKPKNTMPSSSSNKLYHGTMSGDILDSLTKLEDIHYYGNKKLLQKSPKHMESLKMTLKAVIPSNQSKVSVNGLVYIIQHLQVEPHDVFEVTGPTDSDHYLQFPDVSVVESLQADIFKKHSIQRYDSLLRNSFFESNHFGGKYSLPAHSNMPKRFKWKPVVEKAKFFRHTDEVAVVLEGTNLWFCHHIKVGTRGEARFINMNAKGQDTTMRSINFNYVPKQEDDLLIGRKCTKVDITLFSHFHKFNALRDIEAKKMENYEISFRQRQLARLTPSEIIQLSLLSAILERSPKSQNTSRPSKRFNTICKFLEYATKIVPIESICHAIENESFGNSWRCAEILIDSEITPKPSLLFATSLRLAHIRLTTGVKPLELQRAQNQAIKEIWDTYSPIRTNIKVSEDEVVVTAESGRTRPVLKRSPEGTLHVESEVVFDGLHQPPLFSDVVRAGKKHSVSIRKPEQSKAITYTSKHYKIISSLEKMSDSIAKQFTRKRHGNAICGLNISALYPVQIAGNKIRTNKLKAPIDFLKDTKKKLADLQKRAQDEISLQAIDNDVDDKETAELHNEEMIEILNNLMSHELAICLSLLGAFMERQMRVPFVNSLSETAHVLETIQSSPAIGVWTLFSLNMMNMQSLFSSHDGRLIIEVEKYIQGILRHSDRDHSPDRGRYAGKLQFLMVSMGETVSCNSQYISYSLERQLSALCKNFKITPETGVDSIVNEWESKFKNSILFHVMVGFRPLLARWLIWSLNIHKLREELASHTTVGIVGLSKSGKSCLMKELFNQNAISGTTQIQRTTVPFLYNLEGIVDGLSVADFPGVDDKDKNVINISKILLQLSQIIILVIDYRRISTQSAMEWIELLDKSGVPVLLCLTHGDKLYAEFLKLQGQDCSDEVAKRLVAKEFENIKRPLSKCPSRKVVLCSFSQDGDSKLNCEHGRATLFKIGISSQKDVGEWLVDTLKHQQQNSIAEKLHRYLNTNHEDARDCTQPLSQEGESIPSSPEAVTEVPQLLPGVNVYADTVVEIQRETHYQSVDWNGYGIKITIPPDAVEEGVKYTITIKAVHIEEKNVSFPHDNVQIVSAFYWIFSSHKFLKPVDLLIDHCARLEEKSAVSQMQVVSARCDKGMPYIFSKRTSKFELESRKALISTSSFSIFAIIKSFMSRSLLFGLEEATTFPAVTSSPSPHSNTHYVYLVLGKKASSLANVWHFDFYFLKDIIPLVKKIQQKCSAEGWYEDTPPTPFDFSPSDEGIRIVLPPDEQQFSGWKIKQKSRRQITQSDVNNRHDESTTQHCYRLAFHWFGEGNPNPIDYTVTFKGMRDSFPVDLIVPLSNVSTASHNEPVVPPVVQNVDHVPANVHVHVNPNVNVTNNINVN